MFGKKKEIDTLSEKVKKRDVYIRMFKISLLIILMFLIILYLLLGIIYAQGPFTVTLDPNFASSSGIIMYESLSDKRQKQILEAERLEFMDNISISWLPKNIQNEAEGSHNGDNYIAYTFYLENQGVETVDYWYRVIVDDVIKDVDEAIRIMIFINDESTVYAKASNSGGAETGTEKFYSDEIALVEERTLFAPGDIDKITIVIFLEGDDPQCIDNIIGGEMKMHMDITEEHQMPIES